MATKTLMTVKDYAALDEPAGVRYELSNGELIVTLHRLTLTTQSATA